MPQQKVDKNMESLQMMQALRGGQPQLDPVSLLHVLAGLQGQQQEQAMKERMLPSQIAGSQSENRLRDAEAQNILSMMQPQIAHLAAGDETAKGHLANETAMTQPNIAHMAAEDERGRAQSSIEAGRFGNESRMIDPQIQHLLALTGNVGMNTNKTAAETGMIPDQSANIRAGTEHTQAQTGLVPYQKREIEAGAHRQEADARNTLEQMSFTKKLNDARMSGDMGGLFGGHSTAGSEPHPADVMDALAKPTGSKELAAHAQVLRQGSGMLMSPSESRHETFGLGQDRNIDPASTLVNSLLEMNPLSMMTAPAGLATDATVNVLNHFIPGMADTYKKKAQLPNNPLHVLWNTALK